MGHPAIPDRDVLRQRLLAMRDELSRLEVLLHDASNELPADPVERIDEILAKRHREARTYVRETYVSIEMIGASFAVDVYHEELPR